MTRRIDAREMLVDMRSGMGESELMEKYNISLQELKRVRRLMARERKARAEAMAADLRAGLSDAALMEKYRLSEDGLRRILETLLSVKLVTTGEVCNERMAPHEVILLDLRATPRHFPALPVTVCDHREPKRRYVLQDISEHGLAVKGIEAQVTEVKNIAVLGDDFAAVAPFELEAECRWTRNGTSDGEPLAGFRITKISPEDSNRLLAFIQTFTHPYEGELGA